MVVNSSGSTFPKYGGFLEHLTPTIRLLEMMAVDVTEASWPGLLGCFVGGDRRALATRVSTSRAM
jgi:hypothetical protein